MEIQVNTSQPCPYPTSIQGSTNTVLSVSILITHLNTSFDFDSYCMQESTHHTEIGGGRRKQCGEKVVNKMANVLVETLEQFPWFNNDIYISDNTMLTLRKKFKSKMSKKWLSYFGKTIAWVLGTKFGNYFTHTRPINTQNSNINKGSKKTKSTLIPPKSNSTPKSVDCKPIPGSTSDPSMRPNSVSFKQNV